MHGIGLDAFNTLVSRLMSAAVADEAMAIVQKLDASARPNAHQLIGNTATLLADGVYRALGVDHLPRAAHGRSATGRRGGRQLLRDTLLRRCRRRMWQRATRRTSTCGATAPIHLLIRPDTPCRTTHSGLAQSTTLLRLFA